jgi:hypothetical protein
VRDRIGNPNVFADAASVSIARLLGGANPPRFAFGVAAGRETAAAIAALAQASTTNQRSFTTSQA